MLPSSIVVLVLAIESCPLISLNLSKVGDYFVVPIDGQYRGLCLLTGRSRVVVPSWTR